MASLISFRKASREEDFSKLAGIMASNLIALGFWLLTARSMSVLGYTLTTLTQEAEVGIEPLEGCMK